MATLTVTERGQVTFRKDLMRHLGIRAGEKIEVHMIDDGALSVHAARRTKRLTDIYGMLAGHSTKIASLEEINAAIADGWSGRR